MKGASNLPEEDPTVGNVDENDVSTNEEATSIPWFAGEQKIAVRWITPIYNPYYKDAPQTRPGKK